MDQLKVHSIGQGNGGHSHSVTVDTQLGSDGQPAPRPRSRSRSKGRHASQEQHHRKHRRERSRSRSSHRHKSKSRHKHHHRDVSPGRSGKRSRSRSRHRARPDNSVSASHHSNGTAHRSKHGHSRSDSPSGSPDVVVLARRRVSSPANRHPHSPPRISAQAAEDCKLPHDLQALDKQPKARSRERSSGRHRDDSRGRQRDDSRGRRQRESSQDRGRGRHHDYSRGSVRDESRDRSRGRGRERSRDRLKDRRSPHRYTDDSRAYSRHDGEPLRRDRGAADDQTRPSSQHVSRQASDRLPVSGHPAAAVHQEQVDRQQSQGSGGRTPVVTEVSSGKQPTACGEVYMSSPGAVSIPMPPSQTVDVQLAREGSQKLPALASPSKPAAAEPRQVKLSFVDDEEEEEEHQARSKQQGLGGPGSGATGPAPAAHKSHKRQPVVTPNPNANIVRLSVPAPLTSTAQAASDLPASTSGYQHNKLRSGDPPASAAAHYGAHSSKASNIILMDDTGDLSGSSSGLSCSSDVEEDEEAASKRAKDVKAGSMGRVVFGVAQARCGRPYMEDRHCCVASWRPIGAGGRPLEDGVDRSYVGVFDGHNGSRTAEQAAARLHGVLATDPVFRVHTGDKAPPAAMAAEETAIAGAIKRAFRAFDDDILSQEEVDGGRDGATALVLLRIGDTMYVAHAGDSRAVLCKAGGVAQPLTIDHKPGLPEESQRVKAAGGQVLFQRCWRVVVEATLFRPGSGLAVSRSLGDIDFKRPLRLVESMPDVKQYVPRPGDAFVILATDGLWDVLSDQDAVDAVQGVLKTSKGPTAREVTAAAEAALNLAVRRGTVDNVTVVVMALTWGTA